MTILRKNLAVAYIEAKDLEDGDLDGRKKNKEQWNLLSLIIKKLTGLRFSFNRKN